MKDLIKFISDQLSVWPLASANFRSLKLAELKEIETFGIVSQAQSNPCRIVSSTAEVDAATIAARPCFLCPSGRAPEQFHIKFEGRKRRSYNIQVNPYPIFPEHLVIARALHIPQTIWHHFPDMLLFSRTYSDYLVFYNGPASGASAPDHLHFQACPRHCLPLENAVDAFLDNPPKPLAKIRDASIYLYDKYTNGVFAFKARTPKSMAKIFYRLLECCDKQPGDTEPRFNLYSYYNGTEFRAFCVLRSELRSHHYYSTGEDHLTMSPGAADMAGMFVVPVAEDFPKLDRRLLEEMLSEVTITGEQEQTICWRLTRKQRVVEVDIASSAELVFEIVSDGAGPQKVTWRENRIDYNGVLYDELCFDAVTRSTRFAEASFVIYNEAGQARRYAGRLKLVVDGDTVRALNCIGVEDYLLSILQSSLSAGVSLADDCSEKSWDAGAPLACDCPAKSGDVGHTLDEIKAKAIRYRSIILQSGHLPSDYSGYHDEVPEVIRQAVDETWGRTEGLDEGSLGPTN